MNPLIAQVLMYGIPIAAAGGGALYIFKKYNPLGKMKEKFAEMKEKRVARKAGRIEKRQTKKTARIERRVARKEKRKSRRQNIRRNGLKFLPTKTANARA
ncbi:MAG: hypothetical protein ACTSYU_05770 [Promethearchaeota archaeon]